jgi:hypothetical protein
LSDGKEILNKILSAMQNGAPGGAAKSQMIFHGLANEVNMKLVNFLWVGKVLQLLRNHATSAVIAQEKTPRRGEWLDERSRKVLTCPCR